MLKIPDKLIIFVGQNDNDEMGKLSQKIRQTNPDAIFSDGSYGAWYKYSDRQEAGQKISAVRIMGACLHECVPELTADLLKDERIQLVEVDLPNTGFKWHSVSSIEQRREVLGRTLDDRSFGLSREHLDKLKIIE